MNAKPKTPPKKAVRNAPSKTKVPARKKAPIPSKQPGTTSKSSKARDKRLPAKPKTRPAVKKKAAPKRKVVKKKLRARQVRLGPIPKYHTDHKSWDKEAVMGVICEKLMSSSKGIAYICRDNKELPCIAIVNLWFAEENSSGGAKPLLDMYTRAKQIQIDYIVDETVEIGDNEAGNAVLDGDGQPIMIGGEPLRVVDSASVQHAKMRSENRRWIAERLGHRKYGNKLELSSDPERPLSALSDTELDAQIAALTKMLAEVNLA